MGGLWGWPKTHRGFEPSAYLHSDKTFPCGFKGIGAEYLVNWAALSLPHICLPLAAAMLGSSLAFGWCGCFLPACTSTSWYFWVSAELPWSCLSGLMQGGFFIWVMLLPELQPLQCQDELCWGVLAPGFPSALSGSVYQWGKENAVLGSDPELKVLFSPWQQETVTNLQCAYLHI